MQKTIVILLGFLPNPRMYKRIELEKNLGNLYVICWDKGDNMLFLPNDDGYTSYVIHVPAGIDPIKRMIPLRKFSNKVKELLYRIKPDVIHVQGLDMLRIAVAYKKRTSQKTSIIYEVADLHRLLVDEQKSIIKRVAQIYLRKTDRRLEQYYDLLIITSKMFMTVYFDSFVSTDKVMYMPNLPQMSAFMDYTKKSTNNTFTVGYIGSIRYKKQMRNLIEASKKCGIQLLIAGYEEEPIEIEPLCVENKNIEWAGRFDFEKQASALYGKCDVIYSVYDASMYNVRVALPNKLYESVYCELPIIVAKNTYLSQLVEEWGVGISVSCEDVDELCLAILNLKNNECIRKTIESNCKERKADICIERYNEDLRRRINRLMNEKG